MKLLFILPYIPYPLNSGGNQAAYNMIDKIREIYDVSLLLFVRNIKDEEALAGLQAQWQDVTFHACHTEEIVSLGMDKERALLPRSLSFRVFDSIRKSMERKTNRRIRKYKQRLLKSQVSASSTLKESYDFVRENTCLRKNVFDIPEGVLDFVYEVSRKGFDVIQVEFYECLPLVYLLPEAVVKVFVQHEIRYIRNENELGLFRVRKPNDEYRFRMQKDQEIKALSHFDTVVALTEVDRKLMLEECPQLNVYVSPAVISLPEVSCPEFREARELVFIGSGSHFPNADGLMWFCREVMPILTARHRQLRLNVVGVWDENLRAYLKTFCPEICFQGFVDDLLGFVSGKISIVPIRIGSGMRMKILDSIVACSPVVTTSKGCEGLPLVHEENCLMADTAADFALAIERYIGHADLQKRFVEKLYLDFYENFKIEGLVERRLSLYKEIERRV